MTRKSGLKQLCIAAACMLATGHAHAASFVTLSVGIGARASVTDPDGVSRSTNTGSDTVTELASLPTSPISLDATASVVRKKGGIVQGSAEIEESATFALVGADAGTFDMAGDGTASVFVAGARATAQNIGVAGPFGDLFLLYTFAVDQLTPFLFSYDQQDSITFSNTTTSVQLGTTGTSQSALLIDQGLAPIASGTIATDLPLGTYSLVLRRNAANIAAVQLGLGSLSSSHRDHYAFRIGAAQTPAIAASIPEPGTWLMAIIGCGMIGGALRRSRSGRLSLS